jgi:glycerol-3-phosphate dehydrogenase
LQSNSNSICLSFSSQIEVTVEVLVIGGGIQGVVALAELHKQNFKTLLVTESDIGAGQTLSSQAYLHSGYPWAQHEEVVADIKKAANFWLKWMKVNRVNKKDQE